MKTLIGLTFIICFIIIGRLKVENNAIRSDLKHFKSQDSINVYLTNKSASDSILINDLANLTTGEKHDEVLQVFKLNKRNVYYYN